MKVILIVVVIFQITSFNLFSQEALFHQYLDLRMLAKENGETLPVIEDNKVVLFFIDNKEIGALQFNEEYELNENYTCESPDSKFEMLLGYSIDSGMYNLFFSDKKKREFFVKQINILNKSNKGQLLSLKLKSERFLECLSYKNRFYILTIDKLSSILNVYEFKGNEMVSKKKLDFSKYKFEKSYYSDLYDVFFTVKYLKIQKIKQDIPNPLDLSSEPNKLYCYNDKIYMTLDNEAHNTKLVTVNLNDYSTKVDSFEQAQVEIKNDYKIKSNSYLYGNNLFQIKGDNNNLVLQIKNIDENSLIKEYKVSSEEEILFKNTPIIQKGNSVSFKSEKVIETTEQFLNKISGSDIGVSVNNFNTGIVVTIGGVKKYASGGGVMMVSAGSSVSTPGGNISFPTVFHYNPSMYSYRTSTSTKSVYFKSLIEDSHFNHLEGQISEDVYDRIKDFEEKGKYFIKSQTLFKVGEDYVLGYFDERIKHYYLRLFK